MTCRIHPSILSADFVNLEAELGRISTADAVHVDVMDNHFVPNLTLGLPVVERIQAVSPIPLDAHLMISDADRWAPLYADLGLASVTFHAEAAIAPIKLARELKARIAGKERLIVQAHLLGVNAQLVAAEGRERQLREALPRCEISFDPRSRDPKRRRS